MRYRRLGKTGLSVSEVGFGCGAVGGLLVKGERAEMLRVIARAIEMGVTYFDTAAVYGNGLSEQNLGWVLGQLKPEIVLGTKVQLQPGDLGQIKKATLASVEASLRRLGREQVDLIQLHNYIVPERQAERSWLGLDDLEPVIEAFEQLRDEGKVRFWGLNGLGDPVAVHRAVTESGASTVQSVYNLLNPTSGQAVANGFPYPDYGRLIDAAASVDVGVIAIRVLAGGALAGTTVRHALAAQSVAPIATGQNLGEDARNAGRFAFLVEEGYASSLVEAAIRFALSKPGLSTAMVGVSEMSHIEQAVAYAAKGPLPQQAIDRMPSIWATLEP